ncbi:MAG: tetratricopeptide repeat protein [Leptospirales bacterium]|nr:tetratricopeptide repeat protein [Leptospirales bacterium]
MLKWNDVRRVAISAAALAVISWAGCSRDRTLTKDELAEFDQAQTLYQNKKFEEAAGKLEALRAKRKDSIEVGVALAKIKFFTRSFADCEKILREVLKEESENPYALLWLGKTVAVDPQRQAEAADIFRSIIRRDPENYMAYYYLGRCLEAQNDVKSALIQYQTALTLSYHLSKIHLHMGRLFTRMKLHNRAEEHLAQVKSLGVNPNDVNLAGKILKSGDEDL